MLVNSCFLGGTGGRGPDMMFQFGLGRPQGRCGVFTNPGAELFLCRACSVESSISAWLPFTERGNVKFLSG